jgi:5-(carboxyamino)imidazole ribonucleotide synthase
LKTALRTQRAESEARRSTTVTVAMVGAGQLARMTHEAASALDIRLRVLAHAEDDPAVGAGAEHLHGDAQSLESLRTLAAGCDVLTFDHERIPTGHLQRLEAEGFRLAPSAAAVRLAQDKLASRRELHARGFPVPDFKHATTAGDIAQFALEHGWPLIAKAPRGGYDGRGVWTLNDAEEAQSVLDCNPGGLLVEPRLEIELELAVLVARSSRGQLVCYEPVETIQREAMCREILAPAEVDPQTATDAKRLAIAIATEIDATGVMALELFLTSTGLLVNELALRPHNSGHYTIEGCVTSQFEQHLRAILDLPLGLPTRLAPAVVTVNVVGNPAGEDPKAALAQALAVPGVHVHLYGKKARPGRKLGHVTACGQARGPTRQAARLAAALLEGRRK